MSKDLLVLMPNGRRHKVHCTPDNIVLKVLEDACRKEGLEPSEYELKHHNHLVDLSTTIRFSNLPNKACLELVETERRREETAVTVGLTLDDGERRTAEFQPQSSLYEIVEILAASELQSLKNPTVMYMRQEVVGVEAMKEKTLRHLGLFGGRAMLRLLDKSEDHKQANVSSVYRAKPEKQDEDASTSKSHSEPTACKKPYKPIDIIEVIKKEKYGESPEKRTSENKASVPEPSAKKEKPRVAPKSRSPEPMDVEAGNSKSAPAVKSFCDPENLERRLKIEEEVTFIGDHKAILFASDAAAAEVEDLPDSFYQLDVAEVRRLHAQLRADRLRLENRPLMAASARAQDLESGASRRAAHAHCVVRVQFPDHVTLQAVLAAGARVRDVTALVRSLLAAERDLDEFDLVTTGVREPPPPERSLLEAGLVPCALLHFRWRDAAGPPYLRGDCYARLTPADAAAILASKYRSPTSQPAAAEAPSTSKSTKVPAWFRNK